MIYTYKWAKHPNGGHNTDLLIRTNDQNAQHTIIPVNSENTASKTLLGLDEAIKNIEGKAVTNNPTNREFFDVDIKTGSYQSGIVTELSSSSSL